MGSQREGKTGKWPGGMAAGAALGASTGLGVAPPQSPQHRQLGAHLRVGVPGLSHLGKGTAPMGRGPRRDWERLCRLRELHERTAGTRAGASSPEGIVLESGPWEAR